MGAGDIGVLHTDNYDSPTDTQQSGAPVLTAGRTAKQNHMLLLQGPGRV